jgi:hypothetical protein
VREPEEPADAVQHGVDRGVPQSSVVQVADVELEVARCSPTSGSRLLVSHQENQRCSW